MKHHCTTGLAAAILALLLPVSANCADTASGKPGTEVAPQTADDLSSVSQRMRETAEQMRADLKAARARLEAQKAREEAQQKLKADKPDQAKPAAASKKAVVPHGNKEEQSRKVPAGQPQQAALPKADGRGQVHETNSDEQADQAAKERAAKALREAKQSSGERAFSE